MLFNLLGFGIKTAFNVFKTHQETKQFEAIAGRRHAERMATGELEYKKVVGNQQDTSWKD